MYRNAGHVGKTHSLSPVGREAGGGGILIPVVSERGRRQQTDRPEGLSLQRLDFTRRLEQRTGRLQPRPPWLCLILSLFPSVIASEAKNLAWGELRHAETNGSSSRKPNNVQSSYISVETSHAWYPSLRRANRKPVILSSDYLPWNWGCLFSRNAWTPSLKSSVSCWFTDA